MGKGDWVRSTDTMVEQAPSGRDKEAAGEKGVLNGRKSIRIILTTAMTAVLLCAAMPSILGWGTSHIRRGTIESRPARKAWPSLMSRWLMLATLPPPKIVRIEPTHIGTEVRPLLLTPCPHNLLLPTPRPTFLLFSKTPPEPSGVSYIEM